MEFTIRPMREEDISGLARLSLAAWPPIFVSFEQILGDAIFHRIWPDWQTNQPEAVEAVCKDAEKFTVIVAEAEGTVVGFLAYELKDKDKTGEVQFLAVHPDYHNQGIGTALNNDALARMKESGMKMAVVETGGDPSHAPARRCYEKAGYTGLPIMRYYQVL
jgi:ribosomal protein S18 acetylase RimI-like enzyme